MLVRIEGALPYGIVEDGRIIERFADEPSALIFLAARYRVRRHRAPDAEIHGTGSAVARVVLRAKARAFVAMRARKP